MTKPSEVFEGENSSLKQAYNSTVDHNARNKQFNRPPNTDGQCAGMAKVVLRADSSKKEPAVKEPLTTEGQVEACLDLLHESIQHTPLKLEATKGTDYDKGYIFYQDMVVRDVIENTPKLKAMIENIALTAENRGYTKGRSDEAKTCEGCSGRVKARIMKVAADYMNEVDYQNFSKEL